LDQASPYITHDIELYVNTVKFLLNVSKSQPLERISTLITLEVTDYAKQANIDVFQMIYAYYVENYDTLQSTSLSCISEALCNVVGILDLHKKENIGLPVEELPKYYQ